MNINRQNASDNTKLLALAGKLESIRDLRW